MEKTPHVLGTASRPDNLAVKVQFHVFCNISYKQSVAVFWLTGAGERTVYFDGVSLE